MKNLILVAITVGLSLSFTNKTSETTGKPFEGVVTYDVEYIKVSELLQGFESMLPNTQKVYIKGSKTRLEQGGGMSNTTIITDKATGELIILMDVLGAKTAVKYSPEDLKDEGETTPPVIQLVKGKAKIAGYKCKKAKVTYFNGTDSEVFYTKKIENRLDGFEGLPGLPLSYFQKLDDVTSKTTATLIEERPVGDDLFEIPDDYEVMTPEELEQQYEDGE